MTAPSSPDLDPDLDWVRRFHEAVDACVRPLLTTHATALACRRGCAGCCVDGLGVFEIEAAWIVHRHHRLLAEDAPRPEGACAFLDPAGACRIYEDRPYVCRTQGLPLRWIEPDDDGGLVELRDVCPLNFEGVDLADLPANTCWSVGPFETKLRERQGARDGGVGQRCTLRSLFATHGSAARRLPLAKP